MPTLLLPSALLGLLTLAIPLAVHFLGRRGGKTVRVGSIRLLSDNPALNPRRPRLREPLLLLLRCALLAVLTLALAQPYLRDRALPLQSTHWVLISPEALRDTSASTRAVLDSLLRRGEGHLLAGGFPTLNTPSEPVAGSYWSLLAEADRLLPEGSRLTVAADSRRSRLGGARPALRSTVDWVVLPSPVPPDATVPRDSTGRRLTILADPSRRDEARYLEAAFRALSLEERLRLTISGGFSAASDGTADWIVWLRDADIPPALDQAVRRGATLLQVSTGAGGGFTPVTTALFTRDGRWPAAELHRLSETAPDSSALPVWSDGFGRPVLSARREGAGMVYHYRGRLVPEWGDLVLQAEFPELLRSLFLESPDSRTPDTQVSRRQLLPLHDSSPPGTRGIGAPPARADLSGWLWILAVLLFALERWYSLRHHGVKA